VVDKSGSSELQDVVRSLKSVGVEYETLSAQSLRTKYPSLSFDDSFSALFDPTAGILRADKCLTAIQVCIDQTITDHCITAFNSYKLVVKLYMFRDVLQSDRFAQL